MKRFMLTLTLRDDLVLSERNASTGAHASLDRIPGSALRGWVASRLYESLGDDAWAVFHAGQVRFGDALPLSDDGERGWPLPLSWHADKAAADRPWDSAARYWDARRLFNLAAAAEGAPLPAAQPRAVRDGYVTASGRRLVPLRRERMMTAIAADGVVADGQLFSYQSLARGQRFSARIELEDSLPAAVIDAVLRALEGVLRLGRSRASEFGRVDARLDEGDASSRPASAQGDAPRLRLWLLGDAWLRDTHGRPTFEPDDQMLGLPGARLVAAQTFVRTRRVTPWNAHRALPEIERQLLQAGSVLTLERPDGGFSEAECRALAERGIGGGRGWGLGEVAVQPMMLDDLHPVFTAPAVKPPAPTQRPTPRVADTPLVAFLRGRSRALGHVDRADAFVQRALADLVVLMLKLRRHAALAPSAAFGPANSQWGLLAALAARHVSLDAFERALLGPEAGAVRENDEAWDAHGLWFDDGGNKRVRHSLRVWLRQTVTALRDDLTTFDSDAARLDAWQRLCADARRMDLNENQARLEHALARSSVVGVAKEIA